MPRHQHERPAGGWPTRDEAARSILFSPCALGARVARTRAWVPAMVPWRATDDGHVTADVLDWYGRFADGRPGVLVVEATGIRDVPSGPLLRAGDERFVPGLSRLVETVRARSGGRTLLLIQLIDFLSIKRRPDPEKYFARFLEVESRHRAALSEWLGDDWPLSAPEAEVRGRIASLGEDALARVLSPRELESLRMGHRERVTDVHLPHVRDLPRHLPDLFARAASVAARAGFDGVELHFAHAYTMASFLSALNVREDGYGGPREQRARLPLEVFRAVRAVAPRELVVGCRYLGDEVIEGGNRVDDAVYFGERFARAGMDFLSISKGGKFEDAKQPKVGHAAYPYTGPSGHECMPTVHIDEVGPFSRNVPLAAAIRRAIRAAGLSTPVIGAGGLCSFAQCEGHLVRGELDFVGAARQSLADPDWWRKMELGEGDAIRRCKMTNYCEALDQQHKQVTCQLWDREGLDEPGVTRSHDGKRRLVPPPWSPRSG
ncbi:MAG: NADH:flavin oxidoreductase [Deltaproteobacteria bacterium]|nr:NADH:flavin oxidoreductase [Deltaproteobacteria bacterium]